MSELEATYHKLTREVKSLASLCHPNIVSYNQSWFEPSDDKRSPLNPEEDGEEQTEEDMFKMDSEEASMEGRDIFKFSKFANRTDFQSQDSDVSEKRVVVPKTKDGDLKALLLKHFADKKTIDITLFIQMQLCSTTTLEDWIWEPNRKVDVKQIYAYMEQILMALDHIHEKRLIHRDLKPANILLHDGVCKIGDFGLTTGKECVSGWEQRTQGVGTTSYGSPEQINGTCYNELADMYSFGLILFEMFVPFKTKSEKIQVFADLKRGKFPPEACKLYPVEMDIVKRCISINPEKRPTAKEVLNMIRVDKDQIILDQEAMIQMLLKKTREQEEVIAKLTNK